MNVPTLKLADDSIAPAVGRWITAREAAERSSLNLGQVNRRCLEEWQHAGLARRDKLPSGQVGWLIDEAADPRFVAVRNAEQKDALFDPAKLGLTDTQTQEVMRRRKIVGDWNDAVRASANIGLTERLVTDHFLARHAEVGGKLSRATLYNWLSRWRRDGVNGLIDSRWKGQKTGADYADFFAVLTQLYLDKGRRKPLTVCYEIARDRAEQSSWPFPSYGHAHRMIGKLSPAVVAKHRHGYETFQNEIESHISRDYSTLASNDWWCSDDKRVDVIVQHGTKADGSPNFIRPQLHAWEDVRSRKILAWQMLADAPNASIVLRTFVDACSQFGVPKVAYVDNGKHFDSKKLQGQTKAQRFDKADASRCEGAFAVLGVTTKHAKAYRGQSKLIERFFGTLEMRFGKLYATYCGKNTLEKPEDLAERLKAGEAPTLEEFTRDFSDWLTSDYNAKAGHRGDAMDEKSPDVVYVEQLAAKRTLPRELLEFATFERTAPVKIRQNGVTYRHIQFGQFDAALVKRHGEMVKLAVDDRDLTHVYVCDLEGRLICKAKANGKIGYLTPGSIDDGSLRAATAEHNRLNRAVTAYHTARPKLSMDIPDLAIAAARRRNARQQPAAIATGTDPAPLQPVRTPYDDQLQHIQQVNQPALRIGPVDGEASASRGFNYRSTSESEGDDE